MVDVSLTINASAYSIKFAAFRVGEIGPIARGRIEDIGGEARFSAKTADGATRERPIRDNGAPIDYKQALRVAIAWLNAVARDCRIVAVGHRVVHGGAKYAEPLLLDQASLRELSRFNPLAPQHQPYNLAGVAAAMQAFPDAAEVACFDTSFHRGHPFVCDTFGLPRCFYDEGVRRYGFHGLSYELVSRRFQTFEPELAKRRVIIAHLGNSASICGLRGGRSIASTTNFAALDGLPMGTRCGQIDPGALLYLMSEKGMNAAEVVDLIYNQSGLKGMSGLSNDMRALEASGDPAAREAIDYFIARVEREIGSLAAAIGGLDALVFTGGIGENASRLRARILSDMEWLGLKLDRDANAVHAVTITKPHSPIKAFVIPTDEERMIAEHTARIARVTRAAAFGSQALGAA